MEAGAATTALTGAVKTVTSLVTSVFDIVVSNELLLIFAAAALVGVGVGVFKKLKGVAR